MRGKESTQSDCEDGPHDLKAIGQPCRGTKFPWPDQYKLLTDMLFMWVFMIHKK